MTRGLLESLRREAVREKSTINMLHWEGESVELMEKSKQAHFTFWGKIKIKKKKGICGIEIIWAEERNST